MDWLIGAVRFVFFETIFGTLATAAVAGVVAGIVSLVLPERHRGTFVGACVILAGLGHLTFSLGEDRYRFEREALAQIEAAPWVQVVDTKECGDLIAPRTWFDTPVGWFKVAQPDIAAGWSPEEPMMQVTILAYKEKPAVFLADVSCADRRARWVSPNKSGAFVYKPTGVTPISDREFEVYCKTDWKPALQKMFDAARDG